MIFFFEDNYADAEIFKNKLRDGIPPAVYNKRRLLEKPIPNLSQPENNEVPNENENPLEREIEENNQQNCSFEAVFLEENVPNLDDGIKIEPDIVTLNQDDQINFDCILNVDVDDLGGNNGEAIEADDDIIFETPKDGKYPQPLQCTGDQLVKMENDPVSGNLPFMVKVSLIMHLLRDN